MRANHVYRPSVAYQAPQRYRRRASDPYALSWLYDRATEQYVVLGALDANSPFASFSPAVVAGDIWVLKLVTSGGLAITPLSNGTASYSGSDTAQEWLNKIYDSSLGSYYPTDETGDYFTISVNDQDPVETAPIGAQQAFTRVSWEGPILDDHVTDPEGDVLTFDFALGDAPPSGTAIETVVLNSGQPNERTVKRFRGTPDSGEDGTYNIVIRATDGASNQTALTAFSFVVGVGVLVPTVDSGADLLADVLTDIAAAGLLLQDIIPALDDADVGNVFDQSPEGGTYVAPGSPVILYVSGVEMPEVVGEDIAVALDAIEDAGLTVDVNYIPTIDYVPNIVISQLPLSTTGDPPVQVIVLPGQIVVIDVARAYPISLVKTITRKRFV